MKDHDHRADHSHTTEVNKQELTLSSAQKDAVRRHLRRHGIDMECSKCGGSTSVGNDAVRLKMRNSASDNGHTFIQLVCSSCGYSDLFDAHAIDGL